MPLDATPTLAAVRYEAGFDINRLILEVVTDLQARGFLIGGVLQELEAGGDPSCLRLKVVDVRTRKAASITQERGRDAQGCKLDPSGLADISHCITDAIDAGVDLIVINKFGRAESEGSGLVSGIADAVAADIPLLTTVREPYLDAWRSFHGGLATELAPLKPAIIAWCEAASRPPPVAGHARRRSDAEALPVVNAAKT
jgi:uncharacterized protein